MAYTLFCPHGLWMTPKDQKINKSSLKILILDALISNGENQIKIIINLDGVFYLFHLNPDPPWPNAESTKLRIKWMSASWMHDSKLGKGILKRLLKSFFSLFFFQVWLWISSRNLDFILNIEIESKRPRFSDWCMFIKTYYLIGIDKCQAWEY